MPTASAREDALEGEEADWKEINQTELGCVERCSLNLVLMFVLARTGSMN